ncbi:MAG: polyprenyl synthetase family protein [Thermomicrobiales bacterium]|nr:polyprenyl synthetase family protein [Thermomicrobiales bacterium]
MRGDVQRVSDRVVEAARVPYPQISTILEEIVRSGGKRLRPMLVLLAGRAWTYEESFDTLVNAAAGVELLHTASLVHDDAVDHSAFRRGKPTLNSQVDTAAVILVGDYLFAQSAILAASTNNPRVVSVFSNSLGHICDGQLMEMMDASNPQQTERQYLARIYGKTASLFGCAAETGAIIGNAPEDAISALRGYGDDLGLAFQIMDDVLDLTGGSEQLGKPAGHDLLQSTITLPVIYYLEMVRPGSAEWRAVQAIVDRSRTDDAFVANVLNEIRASGAVERALARADEYIEQAKNRLTIVPDTETRELLSELADQAVRRSS